MTVGELQDILLQYERGKDVVIMFNMLDVAPRKILKVCEEDKQIVLIQELKQDI